MQVIVDTANAPRVEKVTSASCDMPGDKMVFVY